MTVTSLANRARRVITQDSWEAVHREVREERHPWAYPGADHDFVRHLSDSPRDILEIGIGSGHQLLELSRAGHRICGSDIAPSAVERVRRRVEELGRNIDVFVDDIRDTRILVEFDVVIDRGCFHSLHPEERRSYKRSVLRLLRPSGSLLMKCFSDKEPQRRLGPYCLAPTMLVDVFQPELRLDVLEECHFQLRFPVGRGGMPRSYLAVFVRE